ncbi:hypothetical protein OX283_007025 [Flavobacterium sp. SUN052]|uniref:alginate O-acetyltransferase AlgX-related protein n=1 Tax=Flavobacterium sp. SUN052 TaxID=3002441 RepID=UPI00237E702C|nr:hypothetical protein [Flavobacterium sp. SUN052]MEC4004402.1 hypothetical protein [Flavobacterium sp. SUN052]
MKGFIKRILIFIGFPLVIMWTIEIFCLPVNFFNHRNWEAVLLKTNIPHYGPLYPNMFLSSVEVGDLAHHTNYAIRKKVIWKTDALGFRNDSVFKNPDVIVIGDSFINGTSMTQTDIFTCQLSKAFNNRYKIYNLAPFTFNNYVELLEQGIIKKPKIIIFSCVEKTVPEVFTSTGKNYNSIREKVKNKIRKSNVAPIFDRLTRFYMINWIKARINKSKGTGIQSEFNKKMFFLRGEAVEPRNQIDVYNTAKAITSYKKYCDKIGVKFLFLPMPNKETVYYDFVPLPKQPNYLFELCDLLNKDSIPNINTLKVYNSNRRSSQLMYQLDDTHWNPLGVKLISNAVKIKLVETHGLF